MFDLLQPGILVVIAKSWLMFKYISTDLFHLRTQTDRSQSFGIEKNFLKSIEMMKFAISKGCLEYIDDLN